MASVSKLAKYAQIREDLRAMVLALPVGASLPAERVLAERWGVARMTVRQAIAELAREGLVRSVRGSGNIRVHEPMVLRVRLGSFADAVREHGMVPSTRLIELVEDSEPPAEVAAFLGSSAADPARRVRRLRLGDDIPLALERTWLPAALVPDLTADLAADSLYHYLEDRELLPTAGEESVVASLPDGEEARLLAMAPSRPVLRLVRLALANGRPTEYAEAVFPGDRYQLWFPVS